jgi:hypothetical protein
LEYFAHHDSRALSVNVFIPPNWRIALNHVGPLNQLIGSGKLCIRRTDWIAYEKSNIPLARLDTFNDFSGRRIGDEFNWHTQSLAKLTRSPTFKRAPMNYSG